MAQCQGCGAVVAPQEMQEGLCGDCIKNGRKVKDEYARYTIKKGDKEKVIEFGFNWFYFLVSVLLGPFGGMVYALFSGSLKLGALYVLLNAAVLVASYFAMVYGGFWVQAAVVVAGELVLAMVYNKLLVKFLLAEGYVPANEHTAQAIKTHIK